jgi:hypothetical protein
MNPRPNPSLHLTFATGEQIVDHVVRTRADTFTQIEVWRGSLRSQV